MPSLMSGLFPQALSCMLPRCGSWLASIEKPVSYRTHSVCMCVCAGARACVSMPVNAHIEARVLGVFLRQGFFLNLEFGWWPISPNNPVSAWGCGHVCGLTLLFMWRWESKLVLTDMVSLASVLPHQALSLGSKPTFYTCSFLR